MFSLVKGVSFQLATMTIFSCCIQHITSVTDGCHEPTDYRPADAAVHWTLHQKIPYHGCCECSDFLLLVGPLSTTSWNKKMCKIHFKSVQFHAKSTIFVFLLLMHTVTCQHFVPLCKCISSCCTILKFLLHIDITVNYLHTHWYLCVPTCVKVS